MSWEIVSLASIRSVADTLINRLSDACDRIALVGELPGESPYATEIGLLVTALAGRLEKKLKLLQNAGLVARTSGTRYQFKFGGGVYPFKLMTCTQEAWVANHLQASSGRDLYFAIATAAKNQGSKWNPARGGFEDVTTGKITLVTTEQEVFDILKMPYVPPGQRHEWPVFAIKESGLPPILTKEQMRSWVASVPWTDTMCGGESHQYTFRTSGDERSFVHVAECIRELGYDGRYLKKKWRYLDLDDHFYFTWGASMATTSLINRKKLRQEEKTWVKNSVRWIPLTQRKVGFDSSIGAIQEQGLLWNFVAGERPLAGNELKLATSCEGKG